MNLSLTSFPSLSADRRRWAALFVVCLAQLMIVLDVTIVNVALPSIQHDLGFSQSNLSWVVNAFLVTFGSLLLLAGRLGDLVGRKRVFLAGVVTFTVASLLCGVAPTSGSVDRRAPAPGHRRGGSSLRDPGDHRHRVPGGRRARPGHERLRVRVGRRRLPRPPRRRGAHRGAELALGLLRQPADRRGDVRARPRAHPCRQRARARSGESTGSARCSSPRRS